MFLKKDRPNLFVIKIKNFRETKETKTFLVGIKQIILSLN